MSRKEKALERLKGKPKDFTWDELKTVMETFGYELKTTGGSSRKFIHPSTHVTFFIHEPHPAKILKRYQILEVLELLKKEGHIK